VLLCLLFVACGKTADIESLDVEPTPVFVHPKDGVFVLNTPVEICFERLSPNSATARYVVAMLRKMHLKPAPVAGAVPDALTFSLYDTPNEELGDEGFLVDICPDGITISANTETGLFYACQTLFRLLPRDVMRRRYRQINLPCGIILDYPDTAWREAHLPTEAFHSVKHMKSMLDSLASMRVNRLIWHLCDSALWLVESVRYPQLDALLSTSEVGTIVSYAAARHIDIIPSVDNPQCCRSVVSAFPSLKCDGSSVPRLCLGNDTSLQVVCNLLDEMIPLFTSDYFFVTGPDADFDIACLPSRRRMQQLRLSNSAQLNGWFHQQLKQSVQLRARRTRP